ncbi:hypothetical protein LEP1GSC062_3075 [Leptospira alexanderi serovar Manhao 3 str. L 60]|uniref:Uncharacterized protein n=1 Tax=Leptospira alexanderi serovar Manhao 3 str. L 60 TaxID=1049759 RepID=V6HZR7_9LEPT|nr:hypothetical protein LEP1GSC062_3075 [Leptospira alexanderi serovar Manhao 3 str. L 60]
MTTLKDITIELLKNSTVQINKTTSIDRFYEIETDRKFFNNSTLHRPHETLLEKTLYEILKIKLQSQTKEKLLSVWTDIIEKALKTIFISILKCGILYPQ